MTILQARSQRNLAAYHRYMTQVQGLPPTTLSKSKAKVKPFLDFDQPLSAELLYMGILENAVIFAVFKFKSMRVTTD